MNVCCPECGSRYLRPLPYRSPGEWIRSLLGTSHLRCGDCGVRFVARTWNLAWLRYARCPKCLRMDLGTWTEGQAKPTAFMKLWLSLGAGPYFCEYCRYAFVSLRPRREVFQFGRWQGVRAGQKSEAPINKNGSK